MRDNKLEAKQLSKVLDEFSLLQIQKIEDPFKANTVVGSNILIDYNYRDLGMFYTVLQSLYRLSLTLGAKIAFASVPNNMVSTFSKLGFLSYRGQIYQPKVGLVTPMYLDVQNEKFMVDIDSPFLDTFRLFKENTEFYLYN